MSSKTKAAIFPYSAPMLPIIRHFNDFHQQYSIQDAMSWEGTGLCGKDIAFACNQPTFGIKVSAPNKDLAPRWDTLLVGCCDLDNSFSSLDIYTYFRKYLDTDREILFVGGCSENSLEYITSLCQEYPSNAHQLSFSRGLAYNFVDAQFSPVSVPIILVGGLASGDEVLEVILSLKKMFCDDGHTVSCITNSDMGLLLGMHTFNSIFNNYCLREDEKILHLNQMAREIIAAERPELLIVEAPDTIMKFADIAPNGFGIRTAMLNLALSPDMLICCMPFDFISRDYVEVIGKDWREKFGFPLIGVHVNNAIVDFTAASQSHKVSVIYTNMALVRDTVANQAQNCEVPIFNVMLNGCAGIYQHLQSFFEKD